MTRKIAGLESDLKIQQQKNTPVEKQLEDAESKIKQVRNSCRCPVNFYLRIKPL